MRKISLTLLTLLMSYFTAFPQAGQNTVISARLESYAGNTVSDYSEFKFERGHSSIDIKGARWICEEVMTSGNSDSKELAYTFKLERGSVKSKGVSVNFSFSGWSRNNYVIMPSAVYDGNRFDVLKYTYPPLFRREDYRVDMPVTITDVPRLNKYSGESRIDLNTGDLSTPSIGIFFPESGKGIWIVTEQSTRLGNSVLTLVENEERTKACFSISAPCVREKLYTMTNLSASKETGSDWSEGDKVTIRCKIYHFDNISSPADLNNKFAAVRNCYGSTDYIHQLPFSEAFKLMEDQQNRECWDEKNSYYTLGGEGWNLKWQLGWVGGCMVTYPLYLLGDSVSRERSFRNYDKIIRTSQAKSGFYYSCSNGTEWCSDCFTGPLPDNLLLLRKDADALYYIYKYSLACKARNPDWEMPDSWKMPLRKFADAFVLLWNRAGQFGQRIDIETGEIKIGGSNSAVMAVGGLALASLYEHRPELLEVAENAGRYYHKNFIRKGISCGGPGEILQNNDAESAFASLESFMVLYEITGEKEWLNYSIDAAGLCSTWMVSYDYKFPPNSLFGRLDMRTSGAVWANTQNKHGGPGICTASGDCLFKLFRATGNRFYMEMLNDLAHNLMQYISREDRPISKQQPGWINERVNLSDWEGKEQVGGIFHGNTWAQVSAMMTVAEIPGIYINPDRNELYVFDHVEAELEENKIRITNPTRFDASVSVFIDRDLPDFYPLGYVSSCQKIQVRAGESELFSIEGKRLKQ